MVKIFQKNLPNRSETNIFLELNDLEEGVEYKAEVYIMDLYNNPAKKLVKTENLTALYPPSSKCILYC